MNRTALITVAILLTAPLSTWGQGSATCRQSSAGSSSTFTEFLHSSLATNWSEQSFGSLDAISDNPFFECTRKAGEASFSILVSDLGNQARALGFASRNGEMKAIVIEATDLGDGKVAVKISDVADKGILAFTVVNGTIIDVQELGGGTRTGCAGVYLVGMAGVGLGTLAGPVGFAVGMGVMMFDLWDNGCY